MGKRRAQSPRGAGYIAIEVLLRRILLLLTKRDWRGGEQLQRPGGIIVAVNHISWFDPLCAALFVNDQGRPGRFLAKNEVFKVPVVGALLRSAKQIPVVRGSQAAVGSLHAAIEAVNRGECVVVYPEGTLTRDPNMWPMVSKSGVARIALATGAPVIPLAQWGAQEVLAPYDAKPHLFPRKTIHMLAGDPVDLDDLRGQPITSSLLNEATARIMRRVTEQLGELRGETPPAEPFNREAVPKEKGR